MVVGLCFFFFFQAEDGIRDFHVTGVQTCALPICGTYSSGYYASSAFPDTPIYDSLVAERGTPQIAPIRVPMPYESVSNLPALPSALPALPPGPSHHTPAPSGYPGQLPGGYPSGGYQP